KSVKYACLPTVAYKSSKCSTSMACCSSSETWSKILLNNNISENVEAVSARGSGASAMNIDFPDAAMLCIACPNSWAKVNTSFVLPLKFTKTYGAILGDMVLQNAPLLFPGLIVESTCLWTKTLLAYSLS